MSSKYRQKIYDHYATAFQGASLTFDEAAARKWARAYAYYLRGWLPSDSAAAICDLACGSGRLLYFLKTAGYTSLFGVDISPEQVHLARQVTPSVDEGDILEYLQSRPSSFDLLTAMDIIEHFDKDEVFEFLELCYRSLRPGGRLMLQTPNAASLWAGSIRYGDYTHEQAFTPPLLHRILEMSGFAGCEAREQGPIPFGYSATSTARYCLWQGIRAGLALWDLAETGGRSQHVLTRVFISSCVRR
jgi:2-polyprenyl-3-methyl-5-hydroxy-6-metoxy-1,4-benzoquinol methylase